MNRAAESDMSVPPVAGPVTCDADPSSITVARAMEVILETVSPLQVVESVSLRASLGRTVGHDIASPRDVPNHTNSAMDGYALSGDDLPRAGDRAFEVVGSAFAGAPFPGRVGSEQCVRIMTGAVMPEGADSVVMQERTRTSGNRIVVRPGEKRGANVRHAGEDIRAGDVVIPAGTRIGASQMGLLASMGFPEIEVIRRPKVAFFSNGDELRAVGTPLSPGEVYDSNRYTLFSMLKRSGAEIVDHGLVADDPNLIHDTLISAAGEADMVITSAGASVGDADYIAGILKTMGRVDFWKVAIKPGRPLSFGKLGEALFFGLPGNPVSVMVTFLVFVLPAIRRLSGQSRVMPLRLKLRVATDLRKRPGRMEFQRGVMFVDQSGETMVRTTGSQGSGILKSMSQANCFIVLPDDSDGVSSGEWVEVQPFDQGI